ncbi:DUF3168 domain-containing protein [Thioclava sp. BHET1]|nr:DUF3168 domain-containing protein [Thioclava sp. BHET1]
MLDAASELQKLVYQTLLADAAVAALVADRIFDGIPADAIYPAVSFGPSDFLPQPAAGIVLKEHDLQLDVWCQDQGRKRPCKEIVGAVSAAVDFAPLLLPAPLRLVQIWVRRTQVLDDPDGITTHGIIGLAAQIEEH